MPAEKISALEADIHIANEQFRDGRRKRKLQKRELGKITSFFVGANVVIGITIVLFGLLEHFWPGSKPPIVTERVLIAAIAGVTVQAGAIILAAFKGLFGNDSRPPKPLMGSRRAPRSANK